MKHGDTEKVERIRRRFRRAQSRQNAWAERAHEYWLFERGHQWTDAQIKVLQERGQAPVVNNVVHQSIQTIRSLMTGRRPKWEATPVEAADHSVARVWQKVLDYIYYISKGSQVVSRVAHNYKVRGRGVFHVYYDPNDLEVKFTDVHPFEVFPDPNSRDPHWEDASYVCVYKLLTWEQVQDIDPEIAAQLRDEDQSAEYTYPSSNLDLQGEEVFPIHDVDQSDMAKYGYLDYYERVRVPMYQIYEPFDDSLSTRYRERHLDEESFELYRNLPAVRLIDQDGQQQTVIEPEMVQFWAAMIANAATDPEQLDNGVFHQTEQGQLLPGPGPDGSFIAASLITFEDLIEEGTIRVFEITKQKIKRCVILGDRLQGEYMLDLPRYPLIPMVNRLTDNPYPESDISQVKTLQQSVNVAWSLYLAHLATSIGGKAFVPIGALDRRKAEEQLGKAGHGLIEYDATQGGIQVMQPVPLSATANVTIQKLESDIQMTLGVLVNMGFQPEAKEEGYRERLLRDEQTIQRLLQTIKDVEAALALAGTVAQRLASQYFIYERTFRIVQPSGKVDSFTVNQNVHSDYTGEIRRINDLTTGRYDVRIQEASMLPENKAAQLAMMFEMYDRQLIDQIEVLKHMDHFDLDELLERFGQMQQLQQQVAAQEEEIKRLKGDLQTADREAVAARKRTEVSRFQAEMARRTARADAELSNYETELAADRRVRSATESTQENA